MELHINLPENTKLTAAKIEAIDKLLAVFTPEELLAFYNKHQLEMVLTTEEQLECRTAVGDVLRVLADA